MLSCCLPYVSSKVFYKTDISYSTNDSVMVTPSGVEMNSERDGTVKIILENIEVDIMFHKDSVTFKVLHFEQNCQLTVAASTPVISSERVFHVRIIPRKSPTDILVQGLIKYGLTSKATETFAPIWLENVYITRATIWVIYQVLFRVVVDTFSYSHVQHSYNFHFLPPMFTVLFVLPVLSLVTRSLENSVPSILPSGCDRICSRLGVGIVSTDDVGVYMISACDMTCFPWHFVGWFPYQACKDRFSCAMHWFTALFLITLNKCFSKWFKF